MRSVTIAENAGFCFGVQRAADKIEEAIKHNKKGKVYTLGHLIHNPTYNKRLADKGVLAVDVSEISRIAEEASEETPVKLFLRAHGVTLDVEKELLRLSANNSFFTYEDCTCPYVKKIHKIAEEYSSEDNIFILMGSEHHPEVVGIMSYFDYEKVCFSSEAELRELLEKGLLVKLNNKRPVLAAQTTQKLVEWKSARFGLCNS